LGVLGIVVGGTLFAIALMTESHWLSLVGLVLLPAGLLLTCQGTSLRDEPQH
jgi:hypothetical protein